MSSKYNIGDMFFDSEKNETITITDIVLYHEPSFFHNKEDFDKKELTYVATLCYRLQKSTGGTFGYGVEAFDNDARFTKVA